LEALGDESEQNVKFPKRLRHRGKGKVLATIYRRPDCYRLYWRARVDGKPRSRFKDFPTYSAAKRAADKTVTDLAKGSEVPKLTPGQASDALAAIEGLQRFYQATGRRMSLREVVGGCCEALGKLHGHTLDEAVEGFLRTVATVKRVNVSDAVEKFITAEEPRTKADDGKRPEVSPKSTQTQTRQEDLATANRLSELNARIVDFERVYPNHVNGRGLSPFAAFLLTILCFAVLGGILCLYLWRI
jgi:hypothetical protein